MMVGAHHVIMQLRPNLPTFIYIQRICPIHFLQTRDLTVMFPSEKSSNHNWVSTRNSFGSPCLFCFCVWPEIMSDKTFSFIIRNGLWKVLFMWMGVGRSKKESHFRGGNTFWWKIQKANMKKDSYLNIYSFFIEI